jgi:cytochrome c556
VAENFWTQADKLAVLAEAGDKPGFAAQYTTTTQACGACHRSYRVRTN